MKVVLITKSFSKGGSASGATNLACALEEAGIEVVRFDAYDAQKRTLRGVARTAERILERIFFDPEVHCMCLGPPTFDLPALVAEHRPDVVQLCDVSGNVIAFSDITRVRCPVVHRMSDFWPYHGPRHYSLSPREGPAAAWWMLRRTVFSGDHLPSARVAPSTWLADVLAHSAGSVRGIRVIRNAVAIPHAPVKAQLLPGVLRFGFISNRVLDPRKGFVTILPRLVSLAAKGKKVALHLYGGIGGGELPRVPEIELISHGRFERSEIAGVFDTFDVLLCPSKLDNSPNAVCEALAHGRPVIAQSGSGIASYLDESTGALIDFQSDSPHALCLFERAADHIFSNYADYSSRAAAYVARNLAPRAIGLMYRDLYSELLGKR